MSLDPAVEAIVQAVRAEERANAAHDRLDRMNGSIDKLRNEVAANNAKIDSATRQILSRLDHQDGVDEGEAAVEERRSSGHLILYTGVGALAGLIGATTYIVLAALHVGA